MTYDLHRFTTKELLNYVLYDSGAAVNVQGYMSGELLNLILNDSTPALNVRFLGGTIESGIYLGEQAAALADITAYGQIWVKNDTPNTLWFTDDTGVDYKLSGSLHMYTGVDATNPASSDATTTAIVDAYSGVIITLTLAGNAQTIGTPTVSDAGKRFTVVNNDTSTNTIEINGIVLEVGHAQSWMWDGSAWTLATSTDADQITYNPAASYLTATDVQGAIDGLVPAVAGTTEDSKALVTDASGDVDLSGGYLSNEQTTTNMMSKGTVYRFDGVDDLVAITVPAVGLSDWFYKVTFSTTESGTAFILGCEGDTATTSWDLYVSGGTTITSRMSGSAGLVSATASVFDGKPHTVIGTFDRDGNALLYVDGILAATADISGGVANDVSDTALTIGKRATGDFWEGSISEFICGNFAPTASEVKDLISGNIPFKWNYGSQTAKWTSDFSAGVDDVSSNGGVNLVLTGNIDSISGVDDVLRCAASTNVTFNVKKDAGVQLASGVDYKITFDYYADASSGVAYIGSGGDADSIVVGNHVAVTEGSWQLAQSIVVRATSSVTRLLTGRTGITGASVEQLLSGKNIYFKNIIFTQLGAVALYTQDSISETAWYDKANGNDGAVTGAEVLNPPSVTPLLAMHTNTIRIEPGGTPGTNINVSDRDVVNWGQLALTDATNLGNDATVNSFTLNDGSTTLTINFTKEVIGILGYGTKYLDINSSTTSEMYFPSAYANGGNIIFEIRKRGSDALVDFRTIFDAGDKSEFWVSYVTAT